MNKWIKLAVISFTGLLLATFALGLLNTYAGQTDHTAHSGGGSSHGTSSVAGNAMGQMQPALNQNNIAAQIYSLQATIMQMQHQLNQLNQVMQMNQMNMNQMNQMPAGNMSAPMGGGAGSMGNSSGGMSGMGGMSMM